jgi:peptidoglycan hydrolase-like protein with peptidoglycan-binding domain
MSAPSPDLAAPVRRHAWLLLLAAAVATLAVFAGVAVAGKRASANTLKYGMRGTAVKQLQRRLHVRPASGYFGTKTRGAVKRFQRRHHIKATGIAGPLTLRRLGMRVNSAGSDTGGTAPSSGGGSHVKVPRELQKIAKCESGGNPRAVSPSGRYRGKYQFDQQTWEAWGGHGDPIKASESTQDRIAIRLYKARGTKPWPNCG